MSNPDSNSPDDPEAARHAAVSEEDTTAQSTPVHNLIGAAVMGAIAVLAIILSLGMDNPGSIYTAPGLLPLLVGVTLLAMAGMLAASALRNGGYAAVRATIANIGRQPATTSEGRRTFLLVIFMAAYIEALDLAFFEWRGLVGGLRLQWGSFEAFSTLFLFVVLRFFWRGRWHYCLAIAFVFATAIAAIFRYIFNIPVPGSG